MVLLGKSFAPWCSWTRWVPRYRLFRNKRCLQVGQHNRLLSEYQFESMLVSWDLWELSKWSLKVKMDLNDALCF